MALFSLTGSGLGEQKGGDDDDEQIGPSVSLVHVPFERVVSTESSRPSEFRINAR